jgi:dihydrofolate reductase
MSSVYVQNFSVSLDGFGTGEGLSREAPFGHAGERLHEWMFATRGFTAGGGGGVDHVFAQRFAPGIGAEIMGAGKFGPPGWPDDPGWRGWWGEDPPFRTPVFVMTRHTRPPLELEGGTTFHFTDGSPAEVLAAAREAAGGRDVRVGGGVRTLRAFLAADLVDHLHVVVVPVVLGRGERLWDGQEGLESRYAIESVASPSGVTHLTFTRR